MKDESARDKAIENVLAQKLRARATAGNGCPDAEIIAAYFERSLAPKERLRWEAHFDSCAQCQQRIAALVRMDEAGEASLTHPSAKFAQQPKKSFGLSLGGRTFQRWAWAAPVLLVVLVAGLWYTGEFDQVLNRRAETVKPAPQTVATPPKAPATVAEADKQAGAAAAGKKLNVESGASPSVLKPSATPGAMDELKAAVNAPAPTRVAGQLGRAQVASPAPPSVTFGTAAERRAKEREAASTSTVEASAGAPGQAQLESALPLATPSGTQQVTVASASEQAREAGKAEGKGASSGGAGGVEQNEPSPAAPQAGQEASGTGVDAGGALAKAQNTLAPSGPPLQSPTTTVEAQRLRGATRSKTGALGGLFKAGQVNPAAQPATQGLFGTVRGNVRDALGAAIPGATIIVINTSTNVAKVLTANDSGEYVATRLNPGEYTIQASARGFNSSVMKDIPLQARADRNVDFALQVGATSQTVEVQAQAAVAQTVSPVWRAGPHGLIQKYSGQGEWETKPSGVAVDLLDIAFPTHEVGWAVGQDGTVLRSANGGESWGRVSSPTSRDLVRVRATSAESAEITTRSGEVFVTTDGATTWTRAETPR